VKVAGLSIEDSKIRAFFASKSLGKVKPIGTDEIALPSEPGERNGALVEALGKWKASFGIEGVVIGLGLNHFSQTSVELPLQSRDDIAQALYFELEKRLPLEPDQYSFAFHTIQTTPEGTKNLVLAIRKDKLKWIANCLRETGLRLIGVRCTAIEAANDALSGANISGGVLVHQWEGGYHILGFKGSTPEFIEVAASAEEAARHIEGLMQTYGRTVYAAGNVDHVGLDRFIPRYVAVDIPARVTISALKGARVDMDFVPPEFAVPKKDYYPQTIVALCTACVVIFFATTILAYIKDYRALTWVHDRTSEIKTSTRELIAMNREVESNVERLDFLYEFRNKKKLKIDILSELSDVLPKDAWLTSLSADENGKVEIGGFARRAADIIGPIEGSDLFENVEFASPVTVSAGLERFSLKMQVEGQ
jgi:hypothetical protein